jgi:hypothetical protein
MEIASAAPLTYAGYSYRDRADRFQRALTVAETARLQSAADSVYTLRDRSHHWFTCSKCCNPLILY